MMNRRGGGGRGGRGRGRGGGRGGGVRGHRKEEDNLRRLRVSVEKFAKSGDFKESEGSDFRGPSRGLSRGFSRGGSSRDDSRGPSQGLARDLASGVSRGSHWGLSRRTSRGGSSMRGYTRGVSSGLHKDPPRSDSRGSPQDLPKGPGEGDAGGIPHGHYGGLLSRGSAQGPSRKERRKRERALKKSKRQAHFAKFQRHRPDGGDKNKGGGGGGRDAGGAAAAVASRKARGKSPLARADAESEGKEVGKTETHERGLHETKVGKRKRIYDDDDDGSGGEDSEGDVGDEVRATRADEVRRMGLMEANRAEEREIKRLEKLLHMDKKKKKGKRGGESEEARLPQAFMLDGLDYILDAVSGRKALAFYEDDDEVKRAEEEVKEHSLRRLEEATGNKAAIPERERQKMAGNGDGASSEDELGLSDDEDYEDDDEEEEEEISGDEEEGEGGGDQSEEEEGEDDVIDDELAGQEQLSAEEDNDVVEDDDVEDDDADVEDDDGDDGDSASNDDACESGGDENDQTSLPAAASADETQAVKYVPPHQRMRPPEEDAKKKEELQRLSKSVRGLVNRLSEANLPWVSGQLEELFLRHSRHDVTGTLTGAVLAACVTPAPTPERLLGEHAMLVSALHHNVGVEIGAAFLEALAKRFDALHRPRDGGGDDDGGGKECDNAAALLAQLYLTRMVHCSLVLDVLRRLVASFGERDLDAALLLLRSSGTSLRRDDPLGLRELVAEAQRKAAAVGGGAAAGAVAAAGGARADGTARDGTRVRYLLDTMLALKNNDVRKIPGYDPSNLERLRKLLRSLVRSQAGGDSDRVLRVSLEQLLSADRVGRWWVVGSSWSGAAPATTGAAGGSAQPGEGRPELPVGGEMSAKMMELARKQRMNTDIRRGIFCVLMTSEDYVDAFEKLVRMGLKEKQEREIVHVLMDCCLQEKSFNPYYAYLGQKLCQFDRRFKMTFQFSMWDRFKTLGNLNATATTNLVNVLSHLLVHKGLSVTVFKALEFSEMDKLSVKFLRQVLQKLLLEASEEHLPDIFSKAAGNPKLALLREGLKIFMRHFMLRGAASGDAEEAELLRQRIEVAEKALEQERNPAVNL